MSVHISHSEEETRALAAALAAGAVCGDIFALSGNLGAGKSAFARGFIQSLAGPVDVPSPTFTLVQSYDAPSGPVHHFDLYRLEDPAEVIELGWDEALAGGICLVEWPDRAGSLLPSRARAIKIATLLDESRRIEIDDPRS